MRQLSVVRSLGIGVVVIGSGGVIAYQWFARLLSPDLVWLDVSRGIALITGIIGVDTYLRSEQRRRFKETREVITSYNRDVRPKMLAFMAAYDQEISDEEFQRDRESFLYDPILRAYQQGLAISLDLATVAHDLDHLALSLKQKNHLDKGEVMAAITSETSRLLLNPKYQVVIAWILQNTSMQNLTLLIEILKKEVAHHGTKR